MNKQIILLLSIVVFTSSQSLFAQPTIKTDSVDSKPEVSVTKHTLKIEGKIINYTATAGTLALKNEKGESIALFGFTAYVKEGEPDNAKRPITFFIHVVAYGRAWTSYCGDQ
jgi:carboxypeptidase C (cathepsin A)